MNSTNTRRVQLGKITGLFGVKGWLRILSYTDPIEAISSYSPWGFDANDALFPVEAARVQNKRVFVKLDGVNSRDAAQTLLGQAVMVAKEQLPTLPAGDYYWFQLMGLEVINTSGKSLGRVKRLFATAAHDVLVVKSENKNGMIPYVCGKYVKHVDLDAGTIEVAWEKDWEIPCV